MDFSDWERWTRLEERAARVGFAIKRSKYHHTYLSFVPKDDALPVYSRQAGFDCADVVAGENFIRGWEEAMRYIQILGIKKSLIERKEQNVRNKQLLDTLKDEKL